MKRRESEGRWSAMGRHVLGWLGRVDAVVGYLPRKFVALMRQPEPKPAGVHAKAKPAGVRTRSKPVAAKSAPRKQAR